MLLNIIMMLYVKVIPHRQENFRDTLTNSKNFSQLLKDKNEPKLNFSITTGRNLPEFNYYMRKIRAGLSIPLPDSIIINGEMSIAEEKILIIISKPI